MYGGSQVGKQDGGRQVSLRSETQKGENEKDPCPLGAPRNSDTPAAASTPRPRPLLLCSILH